MQQGLEQKYREIYETELGNNYPEVDQFEKFCGYAVDRSRLDHMARELACPLKVNPPHWQHGRVLYAMMRVRLEKDNYGCFVDIGTAKGYSACVMSWALADDPRSAQDIYSIDVIPPNLRTRRNSVAELNGFMTIDEFVKPYAKSHIWFSGDGSCSWLKNAVLAHRRIALAFVDGKHTYSAVRDEIGLISQMQVGNDVIVFDDAQIEPVDRAIREFASRDYALTRVHAGPRTYVVATHR